jgi:RNA polymerase sigma-70 factor (ECF subfamily)
VSPDSFDRFYSATSRRLLRFTYGMCGDLALAQSLTFEIYMRACQRWSQLMQYEYPHAWLRFTATKLISDRWRWLLFRSRVSADRAARAGRPEVAAARLDGPEPVLRALRQLPMVQRRALVMHYLADMSIAELADEAGVGMTTVRSWLTRGLTNLADLTRTDAGPVDPADAMFAAVRRAADAAELPDADEVTAAARRRTRIRRRAIAVAAGIALVAAIVLVFAWGHVLTPVRPDHSPTGPEPGPGTHSEVASPR